MDIFHRLKYLIKRFRDQRPISVMGFDNRTWAGTRVNTMEHAISEANRFMTQGDVAWRIINPISGTIYVSDESFSELALRVVKANFSNSNWKVVIGFPTKK